jgi:hypothetical protein
MSMSWTGKLKNAIEGTVDGSDVLGRLASTTQLESFKQHLSDLRLEAEIANTVAPWHVPFDLAVIGAPLWLAENLVTLAQGFSEAEAAAHVNRGNAMAALTHGQLLLLLGPVDLLQSEISGLIADPQRRSLLTLPLLVRPFAHAEAGLRSERVPVSYARGLLSGATGVAGSVQLLAADYGTFFQDSNAPSWLGKAFAAVKGDLAAAQSRLDAAESRSISLFHSQTPDEGALQELAIDLWDVTNTMLKRGQLIAAPAHMPGASPLPATYVASPRGDAHASASMQAMSISGSTVQQSPLPQVNSAPATSEESEPGRAAIELGSQSGSMPPVVDKRHELPPEEAPRMMPQIGGRGSPPAIQPSRSDQSARHASDTQPSTPRDAPRGMPQIGGSARPSAPTGTPAGAPRMPEIGGPARQSPTAGEVVRAAEGKPAAGPTTHPDECRSLSQIGRPGHPAPSPAAPAPPTGAAPGSPPTPNEHAPAAGQAADLGDTRIDRKDRWMLSGSGVRHRLRRAGREDQAEKDLVVLWEAKGWTLTAQEVHYHDAVSGLIASGGVSPTDRSMAEYPFAQVYRVNATSVQLFDHTLSRGALFTYDFRPKGRGLVTDLTPQVGIPDNS